MYAITVHQFGGSTYEAVNPRAAWFADTEKDAKVISAKVEKILADNTDQTGYDEDECMVIITELDVPSDEVAMKSALGIL